MTKIGHSRAVAILLMALLAAVVLAPVAAAETVGANSFPGGTGAIAFVSTRDDARNWSADGTKLTFSNRVLSEPGDVYQVGADGSGQKNLTSAPSDDGSSSYSLASTNTFAFASNRTNNQYNIYLTTLGPDGQTTELTRLTTNPATDGSPAISPDGRRIAFVSDRDGDEDIYLMRHAPEGPKNVPVKLTKNTRPDPNGPPHMYDFEPDWSPDGTQIVFTSDRCGNMEIYRMKASPEGSKNRPVNLSKSPSSYDSSATWSPDGKKIAFSSDRPAPHVRGKMERRRRGMARAGEELENHISGQRIIFRKTASDTDGELLEVEAVYTKPSPSRPPAHYHPYQEERFEVLSGRIKVMIEGEERAYGEGEDFVVPPGTPHEMWAEEAGARVSWQTRPAMKTDEFFEAIWGLAKAGKINEKGVPNLLQVAVIAREHADEYRLVKPPWRVQRALFAVLAPAGRLLGYRARYPEYGG